eukprot:s3750_g16.t1
MTVDSTLYTKQTSPVDRARLKFFGELTAMAAADVFLGDAGSNVHHWISFMRSETSGNFTVYDMISCECEIGKDAGCFRSCAASDCISLALSVC